MDFVSLKVVKPRFSIAGRLARNCPPHSPQMQNEVILQA